ncbi:hypothetical protein NL676_012071 [Syzygium grande]|nr:hypothetical protein NL676_012071 [Syzygium grande]
MVELDVGLKEETEAIQALRSVISQQYLRLKETVSMGVLNLFVVALMPVLKVLLVTAVGSFLAINRVNLLGHDAKQHMNNLVFYLFTPSLIGSNLADTLTLSSLVTLWFMPVNILLTFIIGSALAWVLIKLTGTPPYLRSLIIGCCAAGNLGNLPLVIIPRCLHRDKQSIRRFIHLLY